MIHPPERCPKCGGPWIPRDHDFMGKLVEDKRCLYCGEDIYHRGLPKDPKRKSGKAGKVKLCRGCHEPLAWDASPLAKYHNSACKWLALKRRKR